MRRFLIGLALFLPSLALAGPPTGLTVGACLSPSPTCLRLTWTGNDTTATGYVIERTAANGAMTSAYTFIAITGSTATSYQDTTVLSGASYYYRVWGDVTSNFAQGVAGTTTTTSNTSSTSSTVPSTTTTSTSRTTTTSNTTTTTSSSTTSTTAGTTTTSTTVPGGPGTTIWSRHLGNASDDTGSAVAVDASGNVFITGVFFGTIDVGTGPLTGPGGYDILLAKYNNAGTIQWAQVYGGTGDDFGTALAIDTNGNVVLGGRFTGTANMGAGNLVSAGQADGFMGRYNTANGTAICTRRFGGPSGNDTVGGIAVDSANTAVVVGDFSALANFGGSNVGNAFTGTQDSYVARYDANCNHLSSRNFTSNSFDTAADVAVDASNNILVAGYFNSQVDFGGGQLSSAGGQDIYLVKLDPTAQFVAGSWQKRFGAALDEQGTAVRVDGSGNVFLGGFVTGPVDLGGGPNTDNYASRTFVAKYTPTGTWLWDKRPGSGSTNGLAVDNAGAVIVLGAYSATANFGGGATTAVGSQDFFAAKYTSVGVFSWLKTFGTAGTADIGQNVAVDTNRNVFPIGSFRGTVNPGGGSLVSAGGSDMILLKVAP